METGTIIMIVGFGAPIFIIGLLVYIFKRNNKKNMEWANRNRINQDNALKANAKIISARQGLGGGSMRAIVHFSFEILDSHTPYRASASWFVESLYFTQCQPGVVISVKVNREDNSIIYPDVPWAIYTEGYDKLPKI